MKLPLSYSTFDVHPPVATIVDADGKVIDSALTVDDAQRIINAVNAHDVLVAELELLRDGLLRVLQDEVALARVDAALALARKGG